MYKILTIILLLICSNAYATPPSKVNNFTSATTIRAAEVNDNFDDLYGYLSVGVDTLATDAVDAITEIKSTLKSGNDNTLVTGTEGSVGKLGIWDTNGDLIGTTVSIGSGANTACSTTCTQACLFGIDTGSSTNSLLACSDATADKCLCLTSS